MTDIHFRCRVCDQNLVIDALAAGWEIRCPQCGASQTTPTLLKPEDSTSSPPIVIAPDGSAELTAIPEFANREPTGGESFEYEAFISYRHLDPDRTWAKWLHTALETYRVPSRLAKERGLPRRLKKLFRDEEELPASANLSRDIEQALRKSRFLIVICSPRTPLSQWVNAEVAFFREIGRHDQILALLIEGEPNESFPQSLREVRRTITAADGLTREEIEAVEPLAADVRQLRRDRKHTIRRIAKLRMLACILGVPFDDLQRRENARRKRFVLWVTTITILLATSLSGLIVGLIHQHRQAKSLERSLADASRTLADARGDAKSLLHTLADMRGDDFDKFRLQAEQAVISNLPLPFESAAIPWENDNPAQSTTLQQKRGEVVRDLKTYAFIKILDMWFPPKGYRQITGAPQPVELPDRFCLTGALGAVRVINGKTCIYLYQPTIYRPTETWVKNQMVGCACVIFDNPSMATAMNDWAIDQPVCVAVRRHDWGQFTNRVVAGGSTTNIMHELETMGPLFVYHRNETRLSEMGTVFYWCLLGEGIERDGEPNSWIDPFLGRAGRPSARQSLGSIYRAPHSATGSRGLLTAQYVSATSSNGHITVELSVPDSVEGSFVVSADLGVEARYEELLDYLPGELVEADVTISGPGPAQSLMETDSEGRLHYAGLSRQGPLPWVSQSPLKRIQGFPVAGGPFLNWRNIQVKCAWIRIKDKPSTLVFANGPRRSGIAKHAAVTPEVVQANLRKGLGKEVVWRGKLAKLRTLQGETHMLVQLTAGRLGVNSFEVFTKAKEFDREVLDYRTGSEYKGGGDDVVVTGIVQDPTTHLQRIEPNVPLLELTEISQSDDAKSLARPGKIRDPQSIRANRVPTGLTALIRDPPPVGTAVKFTGLFAGWDDATKEIIIKSGNKALRFAKVLFPRANTLTFADYSFNDDEVIVEAAVSETKDDTDFRFTGLSIVRKANLLSMVTATGRAVPARDFSLEKEVWLQMDKLPNRAAEYYGRKLMMAGVFGGIGEGASYYTIRLDNLFFAFDGHRDVYRPVSCICGSANTPAVEFLKHLAIGSEVIFEGTILGMKGFYGRGNYTPLVAVNWMATIGEPDNQVTFSPIDQNLIPKDNLPPPTQPTAIPSEPSTSLPTMPSVAKVEKTQTPPINVPKERIRLKLTDGRVLEGFAEETTSTYVQLLTDYGIMKIPKNLLAPDSSTNQNTAIVRPPSPVKPHSASSPAR